MYDVRCAAHGVREIFGRTTQARLGQLECPECGERCPQVISARTGQHVLIECGGENSTDPKRIADGTAHFNLGLAGVDTVVGTRPDGKPKLAYRPITNAELGSNRGVREAAKRQGLTPIDGPSFRSLGRG